MAVIPKPKKKSISKLKKDADAVFSRYIRLRYADHRGYVSCVTCGVSKPWKAMQAGHYEKRSINALRFSERNVFVQCVGCNIFQSGNYPRFAIYLTQNFGPTILEELAEEAKTLKQFKPHQLEEIIDLYKAKIAGLTSQA